MESLRVRVIRSYRVIPHGGSVDDYETWALEFPGVTRAWCRGNYMGPGTVGLFVMRDTDPVPVPNPVQLQELKDYIEPLRPVTVGTVCPRSRGETGALPHSPGSRYHCGSCCDHVQFERLT